MLQESILQYFQPSLSYHLPLRPLFCLFLSGHLRQVLLYLFMLTLYLLLLSADIFCKKFGPRSGRQNVRPDLDPILVFLKEIFEKNISKWQKSIENFPGVTELRACLWLRYLLWNHLIKSLYMRTHNLWTNIQNFGICQATKDGASLCIYSNLPEPSLLTYTEYVSVWRLRPTFRSLALVQ